MTQRTLIYTLLFTSLAANFFLGGYMIGNKPGWDFRPKPPAEMELRGILKALPEDQKNEIAPILKNSRLISRQNKKKIIQARRKLLEVMSTPELNEAELKQTLDTIQNLTVENLELAHASLYAAISKASFEKRLQMVEALKRKHHPRHQRPQQR